MGGRAVSRSLVIILGIICAILAASLAVAAINYTSIISGKDREISLLNSQIAEKNNTISSLNSEIAKLRNQISSLNSEIITLQNQKRQLQTWLDGNRTLLEEKEAEISSLNSQIINLQNERAGLLEEILRLYSEIESLKAPKLITVDLEINDVRPILRTPYIHIYGYVCNVGTNRAYNCRLHVVAYRGAVEAVNTYINLGIMDGESWRKVDEKIYYAGGALTLIIVTPEWTASP